MPLYESERQYFVMFSSTAVLKAPLFDADTDSGLAAVVKALGG